MIDRSFWSDVLRDGALLGLAMALIRSLENYIMLISDISWPALAYLLMAVGVASVVLFVWLVHRFAKRRSLGADPNEGFTFGHGLIYIFTMSLLTGILVGLANALFTMGLGYENFVEAMIQRLEQSFEYIATLDTTGVASGSYEQMIDSVIEAVESQRRPTLFDNILSSMNNYIVWGTLLGLVIARNVRRDPQQLNY
jgi:hypothetical protein